MSQHSTLLHTGWPMWVMLVLVTGIAALFAQRFLLLPARQILTAVLRAWRRCWWWRWRSPSSPGPGG